MSDRHAIEHLLYTYAERLDGGDFAAVAALFTEATYGGRGQPLKRGAAAVLETLQQRVRLHEDGTPRTAHVTTNAIIDVDAAAGTATARSRFTVLQQTPVLPLQVVAAGRYTDRFARRDGAWHFTERIIDVDLVGNMSEHLRTGAARGS